MTIGNGIKKFALELGVGLALDVVRGWFNEQLKNTSPSDLYHAVMEDTDLWAVTPSNIKAQGIKQGNNYKNLLKQYQDRVTTEVIVQWLQQDHPALFSTLLNIPNDKGFIWLDKQVHRIKQQVIN